MDIISLFLHLLNVSISASFLAVAVVLFRLIFKKSPKWIIVCLWALVAIRLIFPVSVESSMSLVPDKDIIPQEIMSVDPTKTPDTSFQIVENPLYSGLSESVVTVDDVESLQLDFIYASFIWLACVVMLLIYALVSYLRLRYIVKEAIPVNDNVWICDGVKTPFILGIFQPKIYLPSYMDEKTTQLVLLHERAHLKRRDHLWKPFGFVLLSVYWFNPVMWLSYVLLCRDIELACDEKVICNMENTEKKAYSQALFFCSVPQRMISACPVAFGEVGVKKRISNVLNYKKPAFWLIVTAFIASVIVAFCFMTDPKSKDDGFINGVDEISELSFPMKSIVFGAHTYTVYEGTSTTDNYFDALIEDAFSHSEISTFLNHLSLSRLDDGVVDPVHEPQTNAVIKIQTGEHAPVSIIFHDNYRKLYMQKNTEFYSVRSKDYAIIGAEAKKFFLEKPYKDHHLVWEYNLASSAWGHGEINVYVDKKYKISGEIKGEGVINRITDEEKELEGISWRPYVEENLKEYKVEIPVVCDGKAYTFAFIMTKVGKNGLASYYSFRADDLMIACYPEGCSFVLSLPENGEGEELEFAYWSYNPYAGATGWYITEYRLPEGCEIKSAEASNGDIWIDNRYYNEPEGEQVVKWSPDLYADNTSPDETDIVIKTVEDGKEKEYNLKVKNISDYTETSFATGTFKIIPENCRIIEEGWAIYSLEQK